MKPVKSLCCMRAQLLSCVRLCDPMDCSPPASSDRGILQARKVEWAVISFSRGSSPPGDRTCVSCVFCIGRQILDHCTTTRSTTYQAVPRAALSGAAVEPPEGERGVGSGSASRLPDALGCSTGQGVRLEGAGAALSSTLWSAEAPCEQGETLASRAHLGAAG